MILRRKTFQTSVLNTEKKNTLSRNSNPLHVSDFKYLLYILYKLLKVIPILVLQMVKHSVFDLFFKTLKNT